MSLLAASYKNIIFDFDGTLVDSAAGVLQSLDFSFTRCGIKPALPLSSDLIGPPLKQLLQNLAGTDSTSSIEKLAVAFKEHYDQTGCILTEPFPLMDSILHRLSIADAQLFLATNKRWHPTELILKHLNWNNFFLDVQSTDSTQLIVPDKASLLKHLVTKHSLLPHKTVYIGDKAEDLVAADAAGIAFFHANWGYEANTIFWHSSVIHLNSPIDLLRILNCD